MTLTSYTAVALADAVRRRTVEPRQIVEEYLERIDGLDARLGLFRAVLRERALAAADALADRPDLDRLPLAGVPVAVKDCVPVEGEVTRNGTDAASHAPAGRDHETVRRLREAGAVVIGLTHVPELCAFGTTDGAHGVTRNPWDPARSCGGSSGGSAAAVAAGAVPLALGADGMGSIRIPSASCGVLGLKPGEGAVAGEHIGANSWYGMTRTGPIAATVADARLMFRVLAGTAALPGASAPGSEQPGTRASPRPLRIAVSPHSPLPGVPVSGAWARGARRAATLLQQAGHHVEFTRAPYPQWLSTAVLARWFAGTAADAEGSERALLAARTNRHAALGRLVASRTGLLRTDHKGMLRTVMAPLFESYDALLTPALARRTPRAAAWHQRGWLANMTANTAVSPFTPPWNLADWPALSVPCGRLPGYGPVGAQLVAPAGGEEILLDLAHDIERLRPWPRTAPEAAVTAPAR